MKTKSDAIDAECQYCGNKWEVWAWQKVITCGKCSEAKNIRFTKRSDNIDYYADPTEKDKPRGDTKKVEPGIDFNNCPPESPKEDGVDLVEEFSRLANDGGGVTDWGFVD